MPSAKNTLNWADFIRILETAVIFFLPEIISNQTVVSSLLTNYVWINTTTAAIIVSLVVYGARLFAQGEDLQQIVTDVTQEAINTVPTQVSINTIDSTITTIPKPIINTSNPK